MPSLFLKLERDVPSTKELFDYGIRCVNDPFMCLITVYLVDTIKQTRFEFCIRFYADELELGDRNGKACVDANLVIPCLKAADIRGADQLSTRQINNHSSLIE
jgi:hypothetical protein